MSDREGPLQATEIPVREVIQRELEDTRQAYNELLDSLSAEEWEGRSANPAWRVRQLMWHVAWANGLVPQAVDRCKQGKNFSPPRFLADPLNALYTKFGSRRATPESVRGLFGESHAAILESLARVSEDEWGKGARIFGRDETVESQFRGVARHYREHEVDILKGLGRLAD